MLIVAQSFTVHNSLTLMNAATHHKVLSARMMSEQPQGEKPVVKDENGNVFDDEVRTTSLINLLWYHWESVQYSYYDETQRIYVLTDSRVQRPDFW